MLGRRGVAFRRASMAWAVLLVLLLSLSVLAEKQQQNDEEEEFGFKGMQWANCLKPPFTEVNDVTGGKKLHAWSHGGSVQIKQNFVRITPDKPSRTGWVFNTAAAPQEDFTALVRFRISGQSESLSGDGMAFWYTQTNNFHHGMLLGSTDVFIGVGVLFDTFANDEMHRDVVVIASNGGEPVTMSNMRNFPGCASKFRRWEGREDFNVEQESVAKISIVGNRVIVEIDAKADGNFETCVDKDMSKFLPPKESKWKTGTHFALSATTGTLHDNHDLLEVLVTHAEHFDRLMELQDQVADSPPILVRVESENVTAEDVGHHVNSLAYEVKDIDERLQKLHHEIEHEVEKVAHRLESLIETLTAQEKRLENRVAELERRLSQELFNQMEVRLGNLEKQIMKTVDTRSQFLSNALGGSYQAVHSEVRSWKTPMMIFAFLVFAVMAYLGYTVFKINKKVAKESRFFD